MMAALYVWLTPSSVTRIEITVRSTGVPGSGSEILLQQAATRETPDQVTK